jgi:hypothetical protein
MQRAESGSSKVFSHKDEELSSRAVIQSLTLLIFVGFVLRLVAAEVPLDGLNREYQGDESAYVNIIGIRIFMCLMSRY